FKKRRRSLEGKFSTPSFLSFSKSLIFIVHLPQKIINTAASKSETPIAGRQFLRVSKYNGFVLIPLRIKSPGTEFP
ncbi:MAG: hypothetical protein KJ717_01860, partial [Proteobacteria bacterium]|nr:hypothetical protein [Pseudomonadota bacterium]